MYVRHFKPLLKSAWRTTLHWLVFAHRWIGIVTCLLFVLWFLSGLVMMYVRMPALDAAERVAQLQPIIWSDVALAPAEVLKKHSGDAVQRYPDDLRLEQWLGEPVYRFTAAGKAVAISAVDGRVITDVGDLTAQRSAREFFAADVASHGEVLERDQWTVGSRFNPYRPLHRITFDDERGTELYVSARTGEVVQDSTRFERLWNWCGAVTHWFYLTELRAHQRLWELVILWVAGTGIVVAVSGFWVGLLRLRRRGRQLPLSPYRGWQAWHHFMGLVGGIFLCTWIFSGWLSMDPLPLGDDADLMALLQARQHYTDNAGADFPLSDTARAAFSMHDVRSARFAWQAGRAVLLLTDRDNRTLPFDSRSGVRIERSDAELFASVQDLLAGAALVQRVRLEQPDRYWYSHHETQPLPVLRGIYGDAAHSWIYIDPQTGEVLQLSNDGLRLRRWLFDALHSLDFPWLLAWRPAWDIVVWLLSLAGLSISISGVVIGWRRLVRRL